MLRAIVAYIGQGCVYTLPVDTLERLIKIGRYIAGQLGHSKHLWSIFGGQGISDTMRQVEDSPGGVTVVYAGSIAYSEDILYILWFKCNVLIHCVYLLGLLRRGCVAVPVWICTIGVRHTNPTTVRGLVLCRLCPLRCRC